jgi:L-rhamnose isomerase/sugar isomerase
MTQELIAQHNEQQSQHQKRFQFLANELAEAGINHHELLQKIAALQIAVPSWALGTGGTRFGRFSIGGEPRNLEEKIEDVALIQQLSKSTQSISLHIPWDIPEDPAAILQLLEHHQLSIDSVNSNTFQDQSHQTHSYKFGSLCHTQAAVRQQAIAHNIEVIQQGIALNSKTLTIWLADGSNFPGQHHFRDAFQRTFESIQTIYQSMPDDWTMLIEYKPFEPNFYSMVIPDWGTSKALCDAVGNNARVLVDLGHHLPNTNIEQIVARLLHFKSLGGFHFNGSMYGDDDLTTGSIKPFQLFLIFHELVEAATDPRLLEDTIAYMIDASHNTKDPIEDLLQSLQNIKCAYAKALLVNREQLHHAQQDNDPALAEQILLNAFQTDVRPLVAEARRAAGAAIDPIQLYRSAQMRAKRIQIRGSKTVASGL